MEMVGRVVGDWGQVVPRGLHAACVGIGFSIRGNRGLSRGGFPTR